MNILMLNYEYPPLGGGGGVFTQQLAEELGKTNNITLITSKFQGQKSYEISNNVELFRVPVLLRKSRNTATIVSMLSFFPASLWIGRNILKKRRFDIVHSIFAIPSAPSGLALARRFRLPHILSILGGDVYDPSKKLSPHKTPLLHYTVRKVLERSDIVVASSLDISKRAADYYNISRKIYVQHLGINSSIFERVGRERFNFKDGDILLVTIGRIIPRKSIQDLIEAAKILNDDNVKLIIIGDGPERENLQNMAEDLHVSDRVFFFGNVSDEEKFQLLSLADIYLSSAQHEGFGIVFLEAMASCLPIVSYNIGGHADFLINEKTGFLVEYGDIEKFAKCTKELCDNKVLRKRIGSFNKEYVKSFSIKKCAMKYQDIYGLIAGKVVIALTSLLDFGNEILMCI
jgi:glycosyltransferase involved in cell wall biosynthesis